MMEDDGDVPQLSGETLKALQEFLQEQALKQNDDQVTENWQLSQFWYDDETTSHLSQAALNLCNDNSNVALISCPTLYPTIKSKTEESDKCIKVVLFEYDRRFSKYESDFEFYDFNHPLNIKCEYREFFDVIIVDPPFLSEECLAKTVETINCIKKANSKIILCTGAIMEDLAMDLLMVKKCSFQPKHKNNLANEFICLTNFGELSLTT